MNTWPFSPGFILRPSGFEIGPDKPPLVIAEIGGNHGGNLKVASDLIGLAAEAKAGAVKFQAYQTPDFLSRTSPYFSELAAEELSFADFEVLAQIARKKKLAFGLTVFNKAGITLAHKIKADFIKISSGDIDNYPLLGAALGLPVFISTGASELAEIEGALEVLAGAGARQVVVMACTSLYPAPFDQINLAQIPLWLSQNWLAGFSDHTLGIEASLGACLWGALVIEKHFTNDKTRPGGDNEISVSPAELTALCRMAPEMRAMRGLGIKALSPQEAAMKPLIRRVIVAAEPLGAGHILAEHHLALKRPGEITNGALRPKDLFWAVGRELIRSKSADEPIVEADFEDSRS